MKNKYLYVPADLSKPVQIVELSDPDYSLCPSPFTAELHDLLDCEIIETVRVYPDLVMICDECGHCYSTPKPFNLRASCYYDGFFLAGAEIVGDVLFACFGKAYRFTSPGYKELIDDFLPLSPVYIDVLTKEMEDLVREYSDFQAFKG